MADGYITLDRILDGEHWTTMFDGGRCITDVIVVTAAFRGIGDLQGRRLVRRTGHGVHAGPPKPLDEPKFDAEITFEAAP